MNRILAMLVMAALVCGMSVSVQAATISNAISAMFTNDTTPLIFEDDDYGVAIAPDGGAIGDIGTKVMGIVHLPKLFLGGSEVKAGGDSIRDVNKFGVAGELNGTAYNELTAVFAFEVAAEIVSGNSTVQIMKPLDGPWDFTGGNTYTVQTDGAMIELYEGTAGNAFNSTTIALGLASASDGTHIGSLGFADDEESPVLGGSNSHGEFYINTDLDSNGTNDSFAFNLSMIFALNSGPFATLASNDIKGPAGAGTVLEPGDDESWGEGPASPVYGSGSLSGGTGPWAISSDGDYSILVPVPAAIWPGLALLGFLGAAKIHRGRKV